MVVVVVVVVVVRLQELVAKKFALVFVAQASETVRQT